MFIKIEGEHSSEIVVGGKSRVAFGNLVEGGRVAVHLEGGPVAHGLIDFVGENPIPHINLLTRDRGVWGIEGKRGSDI